jgi:hypothetical protein
VSGYGNGGYMLTGKWTDGTVWDEGWKEWCD